MQKIKERPIIFSGESVRAILKGRKTQTRRVVRPQPEQLKPLGPIGSLIPYQRGKDIPDIPNAPVWKPIKCPYGKPGDRLWVRETFARWSNAQDNIIYSDNPEYIELGQQNKLLVEIARKSQECSDLMEPVGHWVKVPAIFMPKWAARLWLQITNIRVERVQEISETDAKAEGVTPENLMTDYDDTTGYQRHKYSFKNYWDSLNAKRGFGWDTNPWCWVIEFEKVDK